MFVAKGIPTTELTKLKSVTAVDIRDVHDIVRDMWYNAHNIMSDLASLVRRLFPTSLGSLAVCNYRVGRPGHMQ